MRALLAPVALSAAMAGLAACDPQGPGASGVIGLGAGVDACGFETLEIYAFANESEAAFDPARPITEVSREVEHWRGTSCELGYPLSYKVGGDIGSSDVPTWMLVAWLSHTPWSEPSNATVAPGDVFCAVPFRLQVCGSYGGFCAVTPDVACVLSEVAPPR